MIDESDTFYEQPPKKRRARKPVSNAEGYIIPASSIVPTVQPLSDYDTKSLINAYQSMYEDELKVFAPRVKPESLDSKPSVPESSCSSSGGNYSSSVDGWQPGQPIPAKMGKTKKKHHTIVGLLLPISSDL